MESSISFQPSKCKIITKILGFGVKPDVKLICGQQIFFAHKAILGSCSNFLLELFMQQHPNDLLIYSFDDTRPSDVENLLNFVYEGRVVLDAEGQATGLLSAAKQLKIDSLIHEIETRARKEQEDDFAGMPKLVRQDTLPPTTTPRSSTKPNQYKSISSSAGNIFAYKPTASVPAAINASVEVVVESNNRLSHDKKQETPQNLISSENPLQQKIIAEVAEGLDLLESQKKQPPQAKEASPAPLQIKQVASPHLQEVEVAPPPVQGVVPLKPKKVMGNETIKELSEKSKPLTIQQQTPKEKKGEENKVRNYVRKHIGRPILSSTKINPEDPAIPDDSLGSLKRRMNNKYIETLKEQGEKDGPWYKKKRSFDKDHNATMLESAADGDPNEIPTKKYFRLADLIDKEIRQPPLKQVQGQFSLADGKVKVATKQCPDTLAPAKKNQDSKESCSRSKVFCPSTTRRSEEEDDWNDQSNRGKRRKLPMGKRRRIPASNRPLIISSTLET